MRSKNSLLGGAALAALASTLLFAGSAIAQYQSGTGNAPPSSPSATSGAQPGATTDQTNAGSATGQQQMSTTPSSPSSSSTTPASSSATMSASNGESLSKVKDAKTTLASASVQDSSGQPIGQVSAVHTSKKGTPTTIDVTLQSAGGGQAKTVAIKADKLKFDQSSNTLKSDLTSSEIQSLPTATSM